MQMRCCKWIFQQRITASSMNEYAGFGRSIEYSQFGESIDIDGDTLLVGDSNLTAYQMQNKNKNLLDAIPEIDF